jgi:hypothetical protein
MRISDPLALVGRNGDPRAVKISVIDLCPLSQCLAKPRERSRKSGGAKFVWTITEEFKVISIEVNKSVHLRMS